MVKIERESFTMRKNVKNIKKVNENFAFVLTNYFFERGVLEFETKLKDIILKKDLDKNNLKKMKIRILSEIPIPAEAVPIAGYQYGDVRIVYSSIERRLEISSDKYAENVDLIKSLLNIFLEFKFSEISNIGINHIADCNTGNDKLRILSRKISSIKNWKKNTGFELVIPMYVKKYDCDVTYSVSKLRGGKQPDKTIEEYIYRISSNYNYNFDSNAINNLKDKLKKLEKIKKNIDLLYEDFEVKCKEIINL